MPLEDNERDEEREGRGDQAQRHRRGPAPQLPTLRGGEEQRNETQGQDARADQIETVAMVLHVLVQETTDQDRSQQPDGRVDEEDPAPADGRGDDAADGRTHNGRRSPYTREQALNLGSLLTLEDVAQDRERDGLNGARAQALYRPEQNQESHRAGESAHHRSADE